MIKKCLQTLINDKNRQLFVAYETWEFLENIIRKPRRINQFNMIRKAKKKNLYRRYRLVCVTRRNIILREKEIK